MAERVKAILEAAFNNIVVEVEERPGGRIFGRVIWDGFANEDAVDRQQRIWAVLRRELGAESVNVGLLLAYTPHELEVMQAA